MNTSRIVLMAFVVGALSAAASAQDWPMYRKAGLAPMGTFTAGIEYQRIFTRDLDGTSITGVETDDTGAVTGALDVGTRGNGVELESNAVLARLAYSIYAPEGSSFGVEGYLLLGGADVQLDGNVTAPGDPAESFHVDGDFDFAYGGGVRFRVYSQDKLSVFADGSVRYSEHDSDIRQVDRLDLDLGVGQTSSQDFKTSVLYWQISAYASYEFDVGEFVIAPYGGLRLSFMDVEVSGGQNFFDPAPDGRQTIDYDTHQDGIISIVLGAEMAFTENIGAFIELSVLDETTLILGASYTF